MSLFTKIFKGVAGLFGEVVMEDLRDQMDDAMDHARIRAEAIAERLMKKIVSFFLILLGLIFGLVGLGKFLTATVPVFADGVGYIIVGVVLVLLALFARYMGSDKKA